MKLEAELTANKRCEMEMMISMAVVDSQGTWQVNEENDDVFTFKKESQVYVCDKDSVIVSVRKKVSTEHFTDFGKQNFPDAMVVQF